MPVFELSDPRWLEFVQACRRATPFHHPSWAALIARSYGYKAFALAYSNEHGQVLAGLPVVEVRGPLRGRRWVSLPFTDECPVLTRSPIVEPDLTAALDAARRRAGVASIEVRDSLQGSTTPPGAIAVTHRLRLQSDPDLVFGKSLRPSVRKWIARAEKDSVVVRRGDSPSALTDSFYALHVETRRRQGVPVQPRRYFDLLWTDMIEQGLGFVLLAYAGHTPIAGAVFLAWRDTVIYKYGASDTAYWDKHPNHLIMWSAIKWGCVNGFRTFDFGRSDFKSEGLRRFKKSWGSEESGLVYTTVGDKKGRPSGGRLQDGLGVLIRRTPPLTCRILGELLYKYAA
jgi:CelD/BcsL family acetyltransferase involved in cellulose biosynthesis